MPDTQTHIAVLTGDLVNSTELGPEKIDRAFKALEDCARRQGDWHGAPLHFTRHRGDGWQVVLAKPEMALRSALAFRAAIKSEGNEFDSYIGIADGKVNRPISHNLNDETGEVFSNSGFALEVVKASKLGRMNYGNDRLLASMTSLLDHISQSWTPAQAAATLEAISPVKDRSFTDVAGLLGISRQAATKALEAAGFPSIRYSLSNLEDSAND